MASAFTRTLPLLALLATSANALLVPGGGPAKSDCYLELDVAGATSAQKGKTVVCTDGDPCDAGTCGDNVCEFKLSACINQTDPALACTPPAGLDSASIKGKLSVQIPSALQGPQCSAPVSARVEAKLNKKGKYQKSKSQVKLKGKGKAPKGTKPRTDSDNWVLQCQPRTTDCPPPTTTTTTTTTTTIPTIPPPVCGNGATEQGEECDPPGSSACPSSPSGAILCTDNCQLDFSQCPGAYTFDFTNAAPVGTCGETRDENGAIIKNLGCGGLNIGGGNSGLDEGPTPDGGRNRFDAFCTDTTCTLRPFKTPPAPNSADPDCTAAGCNFGTPLPIPNVTLPALGVCVLNTLKENAGGTVNRVTGEASLEISLNSTTFVVGEALCPKCSGTGTTANPGTGTCDSGANVGGPCTSTNSSGLTRDCPPSPPPLPDPIPVVLTPLKTEATTVTSPDGKFCPDQGTNTGNPDGILGCFGSGSKAPGAPPPRNCRSITERGVPAGPITDNTPANVTLASVFCIPATGNGAVDGSSDLPGPGAVSLPGTFLLTPQAQ